MNRYIEKVDVVKLRKVYTNFDKLYENGFLCSIGSKGEEVKKTREQMRTIVDTFYESHKTGKCEIEYKFSKSQRTGRRYSVGASLQSISKKIRHTLAKGIYHDFDMVNAHPVILQWIAKDYKVHCSTLNEYVNDRESIFERFKDIGNRDFIKTNILKIINNGMPLELPFFQNFSIEMANLREIIGKKNPSLKKRAEKSNPRNVSGSCCNYLLCIYENDILASIEDFLVETFPSGEVKIGALVFDGLMLELDSTICIGDLCNKINDMIFNKFGISIKIIEKEMDSGFDSELDLIEDLPPPPPLLIGSLILENATNLSNKLWEKDLVFEDYNLLMNRFDCGITQECVEKWCCKNIFEVGNGGSNITYITRHLLRDKVLNSDFLDFITNIPRIDMFKSVSIVKKNDTEYYLEESIINKIIINLHVNNKLIRFHNIIFEPYLNTEKEYHRNSFNTFRGFRLNNNLPIDCDISNSLFYNHLFLYFCNRNQECFNYLLNWIADLIQNPSSVAEVMIIFVSLQGLGKDMIGRFLGCLIGLEYYTVFDDVSNFFKNFNKEQEKSLLTVLNELSDEGDTMKYHNKLKASITRLTTRIEPKGRDPYIVNHYSRYMGFTQNRKCINIENHDRRFFMLECDSSIAGNHNYFTELFKEISDVNFIKKTFGYFSSKDLSNFNIRNIPETDIKREQKMNNLSSPISFIMDIFVINDKEYGSFDLHTSTLYEQYCGFIIKNGGKTIIRKNFILELKRLNVVEYPNKFKINNEGSYSKGFKFEYIALQDKIRLFLRDKEYVLDNIL